MADAVYSWSLLAAVLLGGASVVFAAAAWAVGRGGTSREERLGPSAARVDPERAVRSMRRIALVAGAVGLASAAVSGLVHAVAGHGSSATTPMTLVEFAAAHRALWLGGGLSAVGLLMAAMLAGPGSGPGRSSGDGDGG